MRNEKDHDVRSDLRVFPASPNGQIRDIHFLWGAENGDPDHEMLVGGYNCGFFRGTLERVGNYDAKSQRQ